MTISPFAFRAVPTIEVCWEGARRLGEIVADRFNARKPLIVTDPGLVKAGLIAPIAASMKSAGLDVLVFDNIVPDPPETAIHDALSAARTHGADIVVGLGGGSSLDVAKVVAVQLGTGQPLAEMYGIGKVKGARLPLLLVPTTAGTGSEVTNISIITTGESTKMDVVSPQLYADLVVLDAQLTIGLPKLHTAATGIDAMVHAIEAYTGQAKKNPLSDLFAREALRLLTGNLIAACRDGSNRDAREAMLLGATLAGQAFANSPVAAVHALAYPLGGHYHVPHGLSNALMLAPVLRFNAKAAARLYAELADALALPGSGTAETRASALIVHMEKLIADSGVPRRLSDVGVTRESLPMLAADAMKQTRLLVNNPIEVREQDALALYGEAF
ncbi:MAG: iron-containing alcohol dehydrogenase [Ancalomicrobiaceae bacterium]|nr:iron-containing alcohol dehydrogenase [Ancalomicrobiaceae bacterium]